MCGSLVGFWASQLFTRSRPEKPTSHQRAISHFGFSLSFYNIIENQDRRSSNLLDLFWTHRIIPISQLFNFTIEKCNVVDTRLVWKRGKIFINYSIRFHNDRLGIESRSNWYTVLGTARSRAGPRLYRISKLTYMQRYQGVGIWSTCSHGLTPPPLKTEVAVHVTVPSSPLILLSIFLSTTPSRTLILLLRCPTEVRAVLLPDCTRYNGGGNAKDALEEAWKRETLPEVGSIESGL